MFRDITTLIKDPKGLYDTCEILYQHYKDKKIDVIAGIEARGFIFGSVLAYKMNINKKRLKVLEALTKQAQELDMGY